jgi:hypothetical protein
MRIVHATKHLVLPVIAATGLTQVVAGQTIYFLVAEPAFRPEEVRRKDSYVLPLSREEDLEYARYLIERNRLGFLDGDETIVVARVLAGKDGVNRNFVDPIFPEWSWHVEEFLGFAAYTAEILDGWPTGLEGMTGGAEIGFWAYTVVRELGPVPLYLSVLPQDQDLQFFWSGVGTNHVYTLEGKQSPAGTNWFPLPGADWPLRTNHWTLARTNATPGFYRVRAEAANPGLTVPMGVGL